MNKTHMAANFILEHDYEMAQKILEKDVVNRNNLYWLSLIYRYYDQYYLEQEIINRSLALDPDWDYMLERKKWHELPDNDKMVPRQPVHMPRNPESTPTQDMISKMCFVTGGDSNYFPLIVECIESLRATKLYKDVDCYVLNCGLTNDQVETLEKTYKVFVKDPGWDVKVQKLYQLENNQLVKKEVPEAYKAMVARPFMDIHFPGYRYYLWLDADAWIQDERTLDKFLFMAQNQGMGISQHITFDRYDDNNVYFAPPVLTTKQKSFLKNKMAVIVSAFCIDKASGIFDEWRKTFQETIEDQGFWWNTEEQTLGYVFHKRNIRELVPHQDHSALVREGLPIVMHDDDMLYGPRTGQVIGTVHLSSGKWFHYFRSQKRQRPVANQQEMQQHLSLYGWGAQREHVFKHNVKPEHLNVPGSTLVSCRFRVYPWADKPEILSTLHQEAESVVNSN